LLLYLATKKQFKYLKLPFIILLLQALIIIYFSFDNLFAQLTKV